MPNSLFPEHNSDIADPALVTALSSRLEKAVSIDNGVSELVEIAAEKGRKQNKNLKLGICGEHGGDPKSIDFCSRTGLDYVSCSPFRVPVARLSAAQAEIKKNSK